MHSCWELVEINSCWCPPSEGMKFRVKLFSFHPLLLALSWFLVTCWLYVLWHVVLTESLVFPFPLCFEWIGLKRLWMQWNGSPLYVHWIFSPQGEKIQCISHVVVFQHAFHILGFCRRKHSLLLCFFLFLIFFGGKKSSEESFNPVAHCWQTWSSVNVSCV